MGTRKNGRARRRHARGEGVPARKAPENRFPPPLQLPDSHCVPLACLPRVCPFSLSSTTSKGLLCRLELNEPWLGKGLMSLLSFGYVYYEVVWKNESKLVPKSKLSHRGVQHNPRGSSTAGFKWQRWLNGGKNDNPTKSLGQNLTPPKKSYAEFPSHKNLQKGLNDITRKIET